MLARVNVKGIEAFETRMLGMKVRNTEVLLWELLLILTRFDYT